MEEKETKNVEIFVKGVTAHGEIKEQRSGETTDGQFTDTGTAPEGNGVEASINSA
jgi:hypothetical protein